MWSQSSKWSRYHHLEKDSQCDEGREFATVQIAAKDVDPNTGQVTYTAEMLNYEMIGKEKFIEGMEHVVTGIPRDAIMLKDKTYHSDQHLPNAFRHEIGIPTEIFPKQWMDLAQ